MNMMEMKGKFKQLPLCLDAFIKSGPDSNIICIDKIGLVLLQLIDSKSAKNSAWDLVLKLGSLIDSEIFFISLVTLKGA